MPTAGIALVIAGSFFGSQSHSHGVGAAAHRPYRAHRPGEFQVDTEVTLKRESQPRSTNQKGDRHVA
jgi:hypothetical protein